MNDSNLLFYGVGIIAGSFLFTQTDVAPLAWAVVFVGAVFSVIGLIKFVWGGNG